MSDSPTPPQEPNPASPFRNDTRANGTKFGPADRVTPMLVIRPLAVLIVLAVLVVIQLKGNGGLTLWLLVAAGTLAFATEAMRLWLTIKRSKGQS